MMSILKLFHLLFRRSKPGGLEFEPIGDGASPKFRRYRENFAEALFGYVPPSTLGRAKKLMQDKKYPGMCNFQNSILSCVHATISELKGFYKNWTKYFAWRWSYGQVKHYPGGTRFKDAMRIVNEGMLLENYLPESQYWGGESKMQTLHLFKKKRWLSPSRKEMETLWNIAERYKLGPWNYIYSKDRQAIKHALAKAPLPAGLYVQSGNWHHGFANGKKIFWRPGQNGAYGHLILVVDYDDKLGAYYIMDHDGGGLKLLDYNYPLAFVASVEDGRDAIGEKENMLRIIKQADDSKYYVVFLDNTKAHIASWELFQWGALKGLWVTNDRVEVIKVEDFNRIPTDNQSEHLLKIMEDYNDSHKK